MSSLCWFAKRKGLVSCSRDTWYRYIHKLGWKRPFSKAKFKVARQGIRASKPDQIWHVDATQIKLYDGRVYYLQALIDNFSRRVLAWIVGAKLKSSVTADLIKQAVLKRRKSAVKLVTDGGSENVNRNVDSALAPLKPRIIRKIAKVEIPQSNSMIERLFHSLKNKHLYFKRLETHRDLIKEVKYYLNQHNDVIPQSVLCGLTPKEAYAGKDPKAFAVAIGILSEGKRRSRMKQNRLAVCAPCIAPKARITKEKVSAASIGQL